MTPREFLISKIKELVILLPNTKVRYENHELSKTHFVEVVPKSIYHNDNIFSAWEEDVTFEFIQIYPDQNICFISDDAIVGITTIDYEQKGNLYDVPFSINQPNINFSLEYQQPNRIVNQIFTIPIAATPTTPNNLSLTTVALQYGNIKNWDIDVLKNSLDSCLEKEITNGNDYNYALAA